MSRWLWPIGPAPIFTTRTAWEALPRSPMVEAKSKRATFTMHLGPPSITDGLGNALPTSALGNRFMFAGREWFRELQMYDYRFRAYLPSLGRMTSCDPVGESGGINFYAYVSNDASNATDPQGLWAILVCNRCKQSGRMRCITYDDSTGASGAPFDSNTGRNDAKIPAGQYDLDPKPSSQMDPPNQDLPPSDIRNGRVGNPSEFPQTTPSVTGRGRQPGSPAPGWHNIRVHGPGYFRWMHRNGQRFGHSTDDDG